MRVRTVLLAVTAAVAGFVAVTVAVTELLSSVVAFSLLVGLPVGLVGGGLLGGATYVWLGDEDPVRRRWGAAVAAFGVVFLAVLVSLVVVGALRNSQALPAAGVTGVVAAIAVALWYSRSGNDVPGPGTGPSR